MSRFLWKHYLEDDLDAFQSLLASANFVGSHSRSVLDVRSPHTVAGSPSKNLATSPAVKNKLKGRQSAGITLTRADLNWKDHYGRTLLHHMATSNDPRATEFAILLLKVPLLDLYAQDLENGWTSLHRALYYGNITIARALMARDIEDAIGTGGTTHAGGLIKIKDRDGCSPFDVYNDTVSSRILDRGLSQSTISAGRAVVDEGSESDEEEKERTHAATTLDGVNGDELFLFGTNKNYNLGFPDGDDRQFPEKPTFSRPASLIRKLYREHVAEMTENALQRMKDPNTADSDSVPAVVRSKALRILDVRLAKMHSAVLTTDSQSNLYVCGFGSGFRLGTGDDKTRFSFTSVTGGGLGSKKITSVALGLNHTIAVTADGETFSWGSNTFGQLGYSIAKEGLKDEEQVQPIPRQIFGSLKRERVLGCAASSTHSVIHTRSALFTFGKNDGQLGLVDADARSLEIQNTPRQVAPSRFSSAIIMVSAMDKATICLLENHDVLVFANYGYSKLQFPLDRSISSFSKNSFFSQRELGHNNHVVKICSGGSTICALTSEGEVMTLALKTDSSSNAGSTTNPSKIRDSVSPAQKLWSIRKSTMAASDVDVGQDGSVIICTTGGSVWRREKRAKIKDSNTGHVKDYKFSRVPGLTRVMAVRSNAFGAFAAIRKDCDVLRTQLIVEPCKLWKDLFELLSLRAFVKPEDSDTEEPELRFWRPKPSSYDPSSIRRAIIRSGDLEKDLAVAMESLQSFDDSTNDLKLGTTLSDTRIPIHSFLLSARSSVMRKALNEFATKYFYSIPDILSVEYDKYGHPVVIFQGLDILSLLALVFYLYTDGIVDVWHIAKSAPSFAYAYRQARSELMKLSGMLELKDLERATRLMVEPGKVLNLDLDRALADPLFLSSGDIEVQLDGASRFVHSALVCRRCPFFEGLFFGRANGGWLSQRREELGETNKPIKVDLTHIDPAVFDLVLRYLYADVDEKIFEDVVAADQESFLDLVLDVLAVANELMLDRLAQICQKILGSYVNTRNVCQLLNAVAPCSVTDFKDVALEYLCLNLEGMLENGLLDELDEDLMTELDAMVQENQIASMPFSRGGGILADLLERYPELKGQLKRAKQTLIDSVTLKSRLHEDEARAERLAKATSTSGKSPQLLARRPSSDLLFAMDEDSTTTTSLSNSPLSPGMRPLRPTSRELHTPLTPPPHDDYRSEVPSTSSLRISALSITAQSPLATTPKESMTATTPSRLPTTATPWGTPSLSTTKSNLKQIMAQTSEVRQSDLSAAFASFGPLNKTSALPKISQKERKRQQQQLRDQDLAPEIMNDPVADLKAKKSPWQVVSPAAKVKLDDITKSEQGANAHPTTISRGIPTPNMTLRQTVSGNAQTVHKEAGKDAANSPSATLQARKHSSQSISNSPQSIRPKSSPGPGKPHSVQHNSSTAVAEPSLQLSMGDILAQQQREKQLLKEAVAKRSLLEIQEEQAFQDWWDKEEAATRARLQEEEAATSAAAIRASKDVKSRGKGKKGLGRGGSKATRPIDIDPGKTTLEPTIAGEITASASQTRSHSYRGRSAGSKNRRGGGPSK